MPKLTKARAWGGNSISRPMYQHLLEILPEGKTILELGSGWGSSKLMEHWNLYSIEHTAKWFKMYNPQSFFVPTLPKGGWYNLEILEKTLRGLKYDLLFIDAPTGRYHFPDHLDLFDTSVPMIFDDVNRELVTTIQRTSLLVDRPYKIHFEHSSVSFGVIMGESNGK